MKKIILKISFIFFCMIAFNVKAEESLLFFDVNPYYRAKLEGSTEFIELTIMNIDENIAYSLEAVKSPTQVEYTKKEDLSDLTREQIDYLEAISYYGYDKNNPDDKMYMATQELIWEYINDVEVYWTDYKNEPISIEEEKNLILSKIEKIDQLPQFYTTNIEGRYYDNFILQDNANVLKEFSIVNNSKNGLKINDDKLSILVREDAEVTLQKEKKNGSRTYIYSAINSTDVITPGFSKDISIHIDVKLLNNPSAYLEFQFTNEGKAIDGIVEFKIDNQIYKTNDKGYFLSDSLFEIGEHNIEILKTEKKYQIPKKNFVITVLKEDIDDKRTVHINEELKETKGIYYVYRFGNTIGKKEMPLSDIEYELYAKENIYDSIGNLKYQKDDKVTSSKTNEEGYIKLEDLYIGKYYLKEVTKTNFLSPTYYIECTLTYEHPIIYEHISTDHKPLNIMIIGENYKYQLYNEKDEYITDLVLNEANLLSLEYGTYYIKALKEGKLIYTWDVTYHEEKEEFVFFTKDYLNPIIFEMPKTGNKKTFSSELILILLFIIKRIKG